MRSAGHTPDLPFGGRQGRDLRLHDDGEKNSGIRQTYDGEGGHPARGVHFNFHDLPLQPNDGCSVDLCEHSSSLRVQRKKVKFLGEKRLQIPILKLHGQLNVQPRNIAAECPLLRLCEKSLGLRDILADISAVPRQGEEGPQRFGASHMLALIQVTHPKDEVRKIIFW